MENCYNFSFFRAPIQNTVPDVAFSILDAYRYISEPIAKERTEQLRTMASQDEARLLDFSRHGTLITALSQDCSNPAPLHISYNIQGWSVWTLTMWRIFLR